MSAAEARYVGEEAKDGWWVWEMGLTWFAGSGSGGWRGADPSSLPRVLIWGGWNMGGWVDGSPTVELGRAC